MLDLKFVLAILDAVKAGLAHRGAALDFGPLETLNARRKALQQQFDRLRNQQNQASGEIAQLKKAKRPSKL